MARYLDAAAIDSGGAPPDFLSHSHGEGFLRFFAERVRNRALYLFDEPESALSPSRQVDLLKILARPNPGFQVVMATHSPLLMACPGAALPSIEGGQIRPARLEDTAHFRMLSDFCADPRGFVAEALEG